MAEPKIILLGGGLANCLIAWWLHHTRPEIAVTIVEQGDALGGEHTWSYYRTDVSAAQRELLEPLSDACWDAYEVRFPAYTRRVATPYTSISSASLHRMVASASCTLRLKTRGTLVSPTRVQLESGETLDAPLVIDGRGWEPTEHLALAYQKFVGLEVRTEAPHGQAHPIIMDATVAQRDGYRFLYTLPFDDHRILIEDTRYSATPQLDMPAMQQAIHDYARARGWDVREIIRVEQGVLPITLAGRTRAFWQEKSQRTVVGLRAGLFHPTTGYSLAEAAWLAERIAALPVLDNASVQMLVRLRAKSRWREQGFFRLLNRLLFLAASPATRYKVLERFYRLPRARIERFYAGALTGSDRAALLIGKPPVPLGKAMASLPAAAAWRAREKERK